MGRRVDPSSTAACAAMRADACGIRGLPRQSHAQRGHVLCRLCAGLASYDLLLRLRAAPRRLRAHPIAGARNSQPGSHIWCRIANQNRFHVWNLRRDRPTLSSNNHAADSVSYRQIDWWFKSESFLPTNYWLRSEMVTESGIWRWCRLGAAGARTRQLPQPNA